MINRSISPFGFIMNYLDIRTVSLSRAIHVDPSLISKWKTGKRTFSARSPHFDQVISYILKESEKSGHRLLKNALLELCPHETADETQDGSLEKLLRRVFTSGTVLADIPDQNQILSGSPGSAGLISALICEGKNGRREALDRLLQYAENMTSPGEILLLVSEEYSWLLEDGDFAGRFIERMIHLLSRGFHAKFVIYYSSMHSRFAQLFSICSPLIFHRNVEWFYYEYYDEYTLNFSFFILNHAVSLFGLSAAGEEMSTAIVTDNAVVIHHELLADYVIRRCRAVFTSFQLSDFRDMIQNLWRFQRTGAFYSFLPAPAFLSSRKSLLNEILTDNQIGPAEIRQQLNLNDYFRKSTSCHFLKDDTLREPFVLIFQLEEMLRRVKSEPFISGSLTILNGKPVRVSRSQIAREIRDIAKELLKYENFQIVFVSEKDNIRLPSINCWCKQDLWMIQMDKEGFRFSDEVSMVNSAAIALENCIRRVPPERRERENVCRFLRELADELDPAEPAAAGSAAGGPDFPAPA